MTIETPLRSALALSLLVTACSAPADETPQSEETMMPVEPDGGIGDGAGPLDMVDEEIPPVFHGRWSLPPVDCSTEDRYPQGLIIIDAQSIQFYESRAVVDTVETSDDDTLRATYAFSGEGEEWSRAMQFVVSHDGSSLTRSDYGEDALLEPLVYARCPS